MTPAERAREIVEAWAPEWDRELHIFPQRLSDQPNPKEALIAAIAAALAVQTAPRDACEVCWFVAWEPVEIEADCAFVHPHTGGHARCGHCWLREQCAAQAAQTRALRKALEQHQCSGLLNGAVWCSDHKKYHTPDIDAALTGAPREPHG